MSDLSLHDALPILIIVAAAFIYDATQRVLNPATLFLPSWFVLPVAVASVLIKELMYHYTIRVGRKVRSKLIEANAWHHRSDALSSFIVIVGVAGVLAGYAWLDAVDGIMVAGMVASVG